MCLVKCTYKSCGYNVWHVACVENFCYWKSFSITLQGYSELLSGKCSNGPVVFQDMCLFKKDKDAGEKRDKGQIKEYLILNTKEKVTIEN